MGEKVPCAFCGEECGHLSAWGTPKGNVLVVPRYDCPGCGQYVLGRDLWANSAATSADDRFKIACLVREKQLPHDHAMYGIFEDDYKEDEYNVESQLKAWWRISDLLAEFPKPTEILDRSLCNLRRLVEHPMEPIEVSWDDLSYLMFCPKQWVSSQYDAMKKTALVRDVATGFEGASFTIAPDGWARLDELAKKRAESKQAFVAMWFADEMAEVYDKGIKPAIEDAGFDTRQMAFIQHNDDICDVIVAEIRKSRFIVADFSAGKCAKCGEECEHSKDCKDKVRARGGVYFEAGFAMGLGIPVIWTVRKEQLEQIHFDIRQYNFVAYGDAEDLRVQLKNRIGATIQ